MCAFRVEGVRLRSPGTMSPKPRKGTTWLPSNSDSKDSPKGDPSTLSTRPARAKRERSADVETRCSECVLEGFGARCGGASRILGALKGAQGSAYRHYPKAYVEESAPLSSPALMVSTDPNSESWGVGACGISCSR